jgi:membrane protein
MKFRNAAILSIIEKVREFFKYYIIGLFNKADQDHVMLMGGGLAFSTFICTIPLVLIVFSILGLVFEEPAIERQLYTFILKIIPYKLYTDFIMDSLRSRLDEFKIFTGYAGIAGLIGLLFASSGLFSSMRTILNSIFHFERPESAFWSKLKDIGLVLFVMFYFLFSIALLPALGIVKRFVQESEFMNFIRIGFLEDILTGIVSFLVIFVAFYIMYYLVPRAKLSRRVIALSSLSAAILWELAKQLFGFYITRVADLGKVYGIYALIIAVAFWIYYTSVVFIIGAEIGQLYRERGKRQS